MDTLTLDTTEAVLCLAGLLALAYNEDADVPEAVVDLIHKLEESLIKEDHELLG